MLSLALLSLVLVQEPDLAAVQQALAKNLREAKTLTLTATIGDQVWHVRAMRPNFFRSESKNQIFASDGQSSWVYNAATKRYSPFPHPEQGMRIPLASGFEQFSPTKDSTPAFKALEKGRFGERDTLVLIQRPEDMPNLELRLHLDPSTYWPVGHEQILAGQTQTTRYSELRTDVVYGPQDFVFNPPEGAQRDGGGEPRESKLLKVGDAAPEFSVQTLQGKSVSSAGLRQSADWVVLNFWFIHCGYCLLEMPHLDRLAKKFADRRVAVLGVNDIDSLADQKTFFEKPPFVYPTLVDEGSKVAAAYKVKGGGYPVTYVIGKDGKIAYVQVGFDTKKGLEALEDKLTELCNTKRSNG
jgi:peroxiredoxin/outer membrane lipoprotein-sorting protein